MGTFKTTMLNAAYKDKNEKLRTSVIHAGTMREQLAEMIDLGQDAKEDEEYDDNDYDDAEDEEKYASHNEDVISTLELDRLKRMWRGDDMKLFSKQLSWIFRRCAIIDVATDDRASWYHICKFTAGFRDGTIEQRIRHDLKFLTGNHQVYRDEFEQFKATLKCRGDAAISLFYQIRHFCESINWSQIAEFLEFIETNLVNVENAIDGEVMGEDEDPTVEELIPLMKIPSEVDGNWLFSIVIQRHSNKVSWVEIREYLIDWNETRDEVTEYFEELIEKRDRVKLTEKTLDDIQTKLNKLSKTFFDDTVHAAKDDLQKKTKEELIDLFVKSQWYYSGKEGLKQIGFQHKSSMIDSPHRPIKSIDLDQEHRPRKSGKLLPALFAKK